MSQNSKIEWCDATLNAIAGCRKCSPGCDTCYAIKDAWRLSHNPHPAVRNKYLPVVSNVRGVNWTGEVTFTETVLHEALARKKPTRYFVNSESDLFYSGVRPEWIDRHFETFGACEDLDRGHTFLILTKRVSEMLEYIGSGRAYRAWNSHRMATEKWPANNIHLGVSVENQQYADERREAIATLAAWGWTTFVSYEPAIGPVDWTGWEFTNQIISGGESGTGARPSHPAWHRMTRNFCEFHRIAYFFKQVGAWSWDTCLANAQRAVVGIDGQWTKGLPLGYGRDFEAAQELWRVGKKKAGRLLDGREWNEMPEVSHV